MKILFLFLLAIPFFSCEKDRDNSGSLTGTVQVKGGCLQNTWLVAIDNPDADKYSFICDEPALTGTLYNCTNAVYITNLPQQVAQAGKKIRFSFRKEMPSCLSYSFAAAHIEAENIQGIP